MKLHVVFIGLLSFVLGIGVGIILPEFDIAPKNSQKIKKMEQFVNKHPNDANAFLVLGLEKYKNKDYKGALAAYKQAITIEPNCLEAYYCIAQYYSDVEKDYQQAKLTLKNAKKNNPNSEEDVDKMLTVLDMHFAKENLGTSQ
jgi:cytochrome c-type biogenesis protein CcmH/NrfG